MAQNDSAVSCTNQSITLEDLFRSAIGTDATGKPLLRMLQVSDSGNPYPSCSNQAEDLDTLKRKLFAFDSNGNVALRVSIESV